MPDSQEVMQRFSLPVESVLMQLERLADFPYLWASSELVLSEVAEQLGLELQRDRSSLTFRLGFGAASNPWWAVQAEGVPPELQMKVLISGQTESVEWSASPIFALAATLLSLSTRTWPAATMNLPLSLPPTYFAHAVRVAVHLMDPGDGYYCTTLHAGFLWRSPKGFTLVSPTATGLEAWCTDKTYQEFAVSLAGWNACLKFVQDH